LTFGKPLTADWEDAGGLLHGGEYATATTTRGFSAHEHLDAHGLIHMNGRAYDPALDRRSLTGSAALFGNQVLMT
jgi:hypothetical protein